jgi:hypothetical protein
LTGVLVSCLRQADAAFNPNLGAGALTADDPCLSTAMEALCRRARLSGTRAELEQEVRTALHHRVDEWLQRIQNRPGGTRLGYQVARDGITTGLLRSPGASEWTDFTVLNSLRDVRTRGELDV